MVKVSHARCRQCGQTRHRNAKANLCRRCWLEHKPQIQQGWRDIKARRAEKRNGAIHSEEAELIVAAAVEAVLEEEHMPRGGRPATLTPEQEAEIVSLYTQTDTSVKEIAETYGIGDTQPFRILVKHGVTWRRGDSAGRVLPPHIEAMKEVHVAPTPAPQPEPAQITLSDQALDAAIRNGRPEVVIHQWRVEYLGTPFINVAAESFSEAGEEARRVLGNDVEIVMVRRLTS